MTFQERIYELYKKYNFRSSFVLDQYFIIDDALLQRAAKYAELSANDSVLEIGPGMGFLTEVLSKQAGKVIAIEKDLRLKSLLETELKPFTNISLIFNDAISYPWPPFNKCVSNIPYNASAPLTFKLLEQDFERAIIFYQKEFGQKMIAKPGSSEYGRLSAMVQHYAEPKLLEIVHRNSFYPQPQTDACIVQLTPRKEVKHDTKFDIFVRELFRYPSKGVTAAARDAFGKKIEDARKVFQLTDSELVDLFKQLNP